MPLHYNQNTKKSAWLILFNIKKDTKGRPWYVKHLQFACKSVFCNYVLKWFIPLSKYNVFHHHSINFSLFFGRCTTYPSLTEIAPIQHIKVLWILNLMIICALVYLNSLQCILKASWSNLARQWSTLKIDRTVRLSISIYLIKR